MVWRAGRAVRGLGNPWLGLSRAGSVEQGSGSAAYPLPEALLAATASFPLPLSRIHAGPVDTGKYGFLLEGTSCFLFGEGLWAAFSQEGERKMTSGLEGSSSTTEQPPRLGMRRPVS